MALFSRLIDQETLEPFQVKTVVPQSVVTGRMALVRRLIDQEILEPFQV
jgi:hypothetical protein